MEAQGTLKLIFETKQVTEKFSKREFVITTDEQYPQTILLELQGDNCDIIDFYEIGQKVKCYLNLRGREWINPQGESKIFNTIICFRIQPINE
jgi:translation initiation factor IF-3